jgi:hypothetical protein
VAEGDVLVVQLHDDGLSLAEVVIVHDINEPSDKATKYAIGKVDMVLNRQLVENRAKLARLQEEIKRRFAIVQKKKILDDLVKDDPSSAALIDEIRQIEGW